MITLYFDTVADAQRACGTLIAANNIAYTRTSAGLWEIRADSGTLRLRVRTRADGGYTLGETETR